MVRYYGTWRNQFQQRVVERYVAGVVLVCRALVWCGVVCRVLVWCVECS